MRRLAGVLAFALLVVGLSGSSAGSVAVAPPKSSAVLALVTTYNGSRLAWLDPATLRPLDRRSISLPGGAWSPVFSPGGRDIALGGLGTIGVKIVDARQMKVRARVAAARFTNRRLEPLGWRTGPISDAHLNFGDVARDVHRAPPWIRGPRPSPRPHAPRPPPARR